MVYSLSFRVEVSCSGFSVEAHFVLVWDHFVLHFREEIWNLNGKCNPSLSSRS